VIFRDLPDHLCLLRLPLAWRCIRLRRSHAQCARNASFGREFGACRLGGV